MNAGKRDEIDGAATGASLTEAQRRAVEHVDGPVLVLAGPGSGKTRVITRRIARLVSLGIPAWQILALTFTNKAAAEMRSRVDALIPPDVPGRRGLVVSTFHAFSAALLRRHVVEAGLRPGFVIHDSADQRDAMKRAIAECALPGRWTPAGALSEVSRLKNALRSPEAAAQDGDFRGRAVARLYAAYQAELAASNAVDFDDLLVATARLLRTNAEVRRTLAERFRYVLIDEYQDTNHAQLVIAQQIAAHGNIMVVGDPDQSIYGWRGADLRNILEFEAAFPGAVVMPLGENFRSTGHIVATASALISHNRRRRHKTLSTPLGDGRRPAVIRCADEHHEATELVRRIREAEREGVPWRGMAVLYRMNALSRVIEDALRRDGIPYQVVRGTAFFERREVKDALAYLRVVSNPADAVSLRRIINVPARGIGETSVDRLERAAKARGEPLSQRLVAAAEAGLVGKALKGAMALGGLLDRWRRLARDADASALPDLVAAVLDESGLRAHYAAARLEEEDGEDRAANLDELENAALDFVRERFAEGDMLDASDAARAAAAAGSSEAALAGDGIDGAPGGGAGGTPGRTTSGPEPPPRRSALDALRAWLESVALVADADALDPERGAVTLMTLHAAKGLEFPFVALMGLEEGMLPHARALENEAEAEEERRLCYVGITRAERTLLLFHAASRLVHGVHHACIESRFLRELPEEHVERVDLAPNGGLSVADRDPFGDLGHHRSLPRGRSAARAGGGERVYRLDRSEDWHGPARSAGSGAGRQGAAGGKTLGGFAVGMMVRHPIFGVGHVMELLPRAGASSVRVRFGTVGVKTLVLAYAKLERIG